MTRPQESKPGALLPCPFCGDVPDASHPSLVTLDPSGKWCSIQCGCTEVRTNYASVLDPDLRALAIAAWNRRSPALLAQARDGEALRAAGLRVTAAFRAMGVARQTIDHFRCQQECEAAMTALDAALGVK